MKDESAVLRTAGAIGVERGPNCRLSPLALMTDPSVHQDVLVAARSMPKGAAILYRHFGADDRQEIAVKLRQITFARGQQLLIGNDPELAINCGADGVHFTRDAALTAPMLWRARCPDWLITMAGIKENASDGVSGEGDYIDYGGDLSVLDALMVSPIFASDSPSAGQPIGVKRLLSIAAVLGAPIATSSTDERFSILSMTMRR